MSGFFRSLNPRKDTVLSRKQGHTSMWKRYIFGAPEEDGIDVSQSNDSLTIPGQITSPFEAEVSMSVPDESRNTAGRVFGVDLRDSLRYAAAAVSATQYNGYLVVHSYVPLVVAACGAYLRKYGIHVDHIFRLSGSFSHISRLLEIFDAAPEYGQGFDFDGYTCHDVANLLRRYIIRLPESIIPPAAYESFREPLQGFGMQIVDPSRGTEVPCFDHWKAISTYQALIAGLEECRRNLLLYLLKLLALFSSKSDYNHMTSSNLATIFHMGVLSHPKHATAVREYRLNQRVLRFLIDNERYFQFRLAREQQFHNDMFFDQISSTTSTI